MGEVVVPDAVVHGLEVPHALAGPDVEGDEALGEEVVAEAVAAVVVVGRRAGRQVDVAELVVDAEGGPDVGAAGVAPRVVQPGVDPEVVGLRDGTERPPRIARAGVDSLHPAGRLLARDRLIGDGHRGHDDVVGDDGGRVDADPGMALVVHGAPAVARDAGRQVDAAVVAEAARRLAGRGVDGQQVAVGGAVEDARLVAVGPVGQAADAVAAGVDGEPRSPDHVRVVDPADGAGARVERRGEPEGRDDVDDPVHHQRGGLHVENAEVLVNLAQRVEVECLVGRTPAPGDLQIVEVGRVDLIEARVLRAAEVAAVGGPLAVGRPVLRGGGGGHDAEHRAGDDDDADR